MLAQGPKAYGPTIRLGGLVAPGSIAWNEGRTEMHFKVAETDKPDALAVDVLCSQVPPQMFREKVGVVVEGTFDESKVFKTNRLMVNHSNEYKPPKDDKEFKEMMKNMTDMPTTASSK
jgi:cytochrome c-type biogenesis protein CcmE